MQTLWPDGKLPTGGEMSFCSRRSWSQIYQRCKHLAAHLKLSKTLSLYLMLTINVNFSQSRKNKLTMPRDLFNILNLGHSQVCNLRWWTEGILEAWHLSQFQGKDMSEVGVAEAEVGFLTAVSKSLITVQLLQWSKCHQVLHLKCNIMSSQDILNLKTLSNNKW